MSSGLSKGLSAKSLTLPFWSKHQKKKKKGTKLYLKTGADVKKGREKQTETKKKTFQSPATVWLFIEPRPNEKKPGLSSSHGMPGN